MRVTTICKDMKKCGTFELYSRLIWLIVIVHISKRWSHSGDLKIKRTVPAPGDINYFVSKCKFNDNCSLAPLMLFLS